MKKFLVFLVSIIVVICLGMTFYYFAKDEEVIKFKTSTIYINAGESISLEDLGFSHTNKKKETKIDFNAGGDAVKSVISYNSALGKYVSTAKGGNTTIVITTNNRKFKRFEIKVTVGNGSEETPYQIYTEEDLYNVGTSKFDTTPENTENEALTAHYILMNDITITKPHLPIGQTATDCNDFQGKFDGNYYTINNLQVEGDTYGSLFAVIGSNGQVVNLNIKNANISGAYDYAGTLAGVINGYVDRIQIKDSIINSTKSVAYVGGLAGKIETVANAYDNTATIYRVAIESSDSKYYVSGKNYVGGLAGKLVNANIEAIKSATNIVVTNTNNTYCGGISGYVELDIYNGFVRESYSISNFTLSNVNLGKNGALFGSIETADGIDKEVALLGLYFDNTKCSLNPYGETSLAFETIVNNSGKTTENLKSYNTYVFYYDNASNPVLWRTNIWKIVEGQFPVLKYLDNAIPTNIDKDTKPDIDNPDNPINPDDPIDPITPDVTTDTIVIDSVAKLNSITAFESGKTYKVTTNLDLNGATWTGKKLYQAKFVADSQVTISNFKVTSTTNYCGFFTSIVNSTVENITFSNVRIQATSSMDYIGILAGVANDTQINSVNVESASITTETNMTSLPSYTAGLIGACTNSTVIIENCNVNADINGKFKNVGGVIGMTGPNTAVANSTFNGSVEANNYLGGFVAQNKGLIKNCVAQAIVNINDSFSGNSHIGGFVGTNFNTIQDSKAIINSLTINNGSTIHSIYAGGFAGYNAYSKVISNCKVLGVTSSSTIQVANNNGNVFIGGIVALNTGIVKYCKNELNSIGAEKARVYIGGIVCQNDNGTIDSCLAISNVYGDYVGGIAYNVMNNSEITKSAIGYNNVRVTLKGNKIAGISCYISDGNINNCLVYTKTYGLTTNSISAGTVIDFPISTDGRYGVIEYCIISNVFAGSGDKYLSTSAPIFASTLTTGTLKNCVFDMTCEGSSTAYEPSYDKTITNKDKPSASGSKYTKANASNLYLISTYTDLGFSIMTDGSKIWLYTSSGNTLPKIVELER